MYEYKLLQLEFRVQAQHCLQRRNTNDASFNPFVESFGLIVFKFSVTMSFRRIRPYIYTHTRFK